MPSHLDGVTPAARDFIRSGLGSLQHAHAHADQSTAADAAQVIMSLAHAAEMLAKAAILHRGETIHVANKPNRTITLRDALDRIQKPKHAATMLVLVDRRDAIQHAAAHMDPETIGDYIDTTRAFAHDLLQHQFGLRLEDLVPVLVPAERAGGALKGTALDPADSIQRDASYGGGVVVWAQGQPQHNGLRVRVRGAGGETRWLTPPNDFEYMPHTDGRLVVAYRQTGGIVVYDLRDDTRRLLSETGGPGAIEGDIVAAQGIGIPDGLGGGISLLNVGGGESRQISDAGDSPRLTNGLLVWQEFREEHMILGQQLDSEGAATLVVGGQHPAVHRGLLAWTEVASRPRLHARDLQTEEQRTLSESAIFPDVRNGLVAFLEHRADLYDLKVFDWARGDLVVTVENVGFPTGRGPVLTDKNVIWEARPMSEEARLYYEALPL